MPEIFRFDSIDSTMREATMLAASGCPHGTAVLADTQTAGIGRHGHSWYSEPGLGLYVSVVLRLPETSPVLTLALGLAVAEAIQKVSGLSCDLRWPNDVLIAGRKVAGILVHIAGDAAVAGIGINVNHAEFPPDLRSTATSMHLQSGRTYDREPLLAALLSSTGECCDILRHEGKAPILRTFSGVSSYAAGKRVKVDLGGRTIQGVTAGLDDSGFLRVRKPDGSIETVLAGGVRPAA